MPKAARLLRRRGLREPRAVPCPPPMSEAPMPSDPALPPPSADTPVLRPDYPLREHNTFGFDVRARFAATVGTPAGFVAAARDPRVAGLPVRVLGGGSNVVFTGDVDALVLINDVRGRALVGEDGEAWYVEAGGGENWHAFVDWTLAAGMPGLENLALIPGTVGAAPIQNIGAYGIEMRERFAALKAVELASGELVQFDAAACAFGYRDSVFKREARERFAIVSVTFRLPKRWEPRTNYADVAREFAAGGIEPAAATPRDVFDAVVAIRRAKLPDPRVLGNAGSFFKNPVIDAAQCAALREREPELVAYPQPDGRVKLAAGWLIDRCGWKGRALGAAAVHDRQALVLVNRGGATGADVLALARAIEADVEARFGVRLEAEPVAI
ncbi:UDP-N-acetylenolpyruvoylglucosamine reductase [Burkholderia plantarii]|nr:UDP-N-acetylenolpyruvoylglucosamine reductase [Burkholderia plantarii]